MKKIILIAGILFVAPLFSFAASPTVMSFVAGSSMLGSGQIASLTWNLADAGGYSFVIPCVTSVKFKKLDGTLFACDTPTPSTAISANGIDLSVWNYSGSTKTFTARIIPKDASSVDYISGAREIQLSVTPMQHPIENVVASTSVSSLVPYLLSWTGSLLDGINLSLSCSSSIHTAVTTASSPSVLAQSELPCGTQIFPQSLPASGSVTLSFKNTDTMTRDIILILSPMMSPGLYNGMQTERITLSVDPYIAPKAQTSSFAASTTLLSTLEGTPLSFSWTTTGTTGANIILSCNDHITATIVTENGTSTPRCGTIAFTNPLSPIGTGTIAFFNNDLVAQPINLTLLPALTQGGFDGTAGKNLTFQILPKGVTPTILPETPHLIGTVLDIPTLQKNTEQGTTTISAKIMFTKNLVRGASGSDVRNVQEFLKKDLDIYPEGIVNGTFGPATERAIKRFQLKNKIADAKNPGYGIIGPKTRAFMNSLNK